MVPQIPPCPLVAPRVGSLCTEGTACQAGPGRAALGLFFLLWPEVSLQPLLLGYPPWLGCFSYILGFASEVSNELVSEFTRQRST